VETLDQIDIKKFLSLFAQFFEGEFNSKGAIGLGSHAKG